MRRFGKTVRVCSRFGSASLSYSILFTGVQVYEYTELPFGFGTFDYGSTFYAATGFHGFHVLVGTIFLAVCWFRARARRSPGSSLWV